MHNSLTFNNCTLCPHYIYVLYLSENKQRLVPLKHKQIGFYNRDEKCLQRGTDWVFKYSGLRFVCKGLKDSVIESIRGWFVYSYDDAVL
jgi:hypothetical protein